jgi:hypothetical protein
MTTKTAPRRAANGQKQTLHRPEISGRGSQRQAWSLAHYVRKHPNALRSFGDSLIA